MIPDLSGLSAEVLRDLTNVGTVRRASREVDEARVELTYEETDAGLRVTAADGTVCVLGEGAFDTWRCDCASGGSCRHVVRAVLGWQARHPSDAAGSSGPPDEPPDEAGTPAPAPRDPAGTSFVSARTAKAAARARAEGGLVAYLSRGDRVTLVLHAPTEATLRFGADADPRFGRCDCGTAACIHLDHALAVLALAGADEEGWISATSDPRDVPASIREAWWEWWRLLVEVGMSASEELIGAAARLAAAMEDATLPSPAAVMRDLAVQLAHHASRGAEVAPERLILLAGEVEARLRRVRRGEEGNSPVVLAAGVVSDNHALGQQRLIGLGAEHTYVGGWSRLRVLVGDTRTGAVRTLTVEEVDAPDTPVSASTLGARRRSGSRYADWASGAVSLPRSRRRGNELQPSRTGAVVASGAHWRIPDASPLLAGTFAELAADADVPGPLAPRGSVAGIAAARIAAVEDVAWSEDRVTARLSDATGAQALLDLRYSARASAGARDVAQWLAAGTVSEVAGRWTHRTSGLVVSPTLLNGAQGPLVVPLGAGDGSSGAEQSVSGRGREDPWTRLLGDTSEAVGRLLVLGARRGAPGLRRDLTGIAALAERNGLLRWAEALAAVAGVEARDARAAALLDLAVLLAFAE